MNSGNAEVEAGLVCKECGRQNAFGEAFCGGCGVYVGGDGGATRCGEDPDNQPAPAPLVDGDPRSASPAGVSLLLLSPEPSVLPGEEVTCEIRVINTGSVVDRVKLEVAGPAAEWATIRPEFLTLYPDRKPVNAMICFAPPRSPSIAAGAMPFSLRATSNEDPNVSSEAQGLVRVAPFSEASLELRPKCCHGRVSAKAVLIVHNEGNTPVRAVTEAKDADARLAFHFATVTSVTAPGTDSQLALRVRPRRWLWVGMPQVHLFQVEAQREGHEALRADGQMRQIPLIPRWVPRMARLVALGLAALLGWLLLFAAVPTVAGLAPNAAAHRLSRAGFKTLNSSEPSDSVPEGQVIRTDPPPGSHKLKGSAVKIYVSSGLAPIQVPDVLGEPEAFARRRLTDLGLVVESVTVSSTTVGTGLVVDTKPAANSAAFRSSHVQIIISSGPPIDSGSHATPTPVPSPSGTEPLVTAASIQVDELAPSSGLTTGKTSITIRGSGFTGAKAVLFGETKAPSYNIDSDAQIRATAPPGSKTVDVIVIGPQAKSLPTQMSKFTYVDPTGPPAISALTPNVGLANASTTVVIAGTGFTGATSVAFGPDKTSFVVDSDTQITATSPPGSGSVDVTVVSPQGTSSLADASRFRFVNNPPPKPVVSSITPAQGPIMGGTAVTIDGTGFTGATAVHFGPVNAASYTVQSDALITAFAPSGTGKVDIGVDTPNGSNVASPMDQFEFIRQPPQVGGISLASGPAAGGSSVTINGSGFTSATAVKFGLNNAAGYRVISDSQIIVTSPAGSGKVAISVITPAGQASSSEVFTYISPTVSGFTPSGGSGGTTVIINGTGFIEAALVKFGDTNVAGYIVNSDTQITVTAPAGSGAVAITVITPSGSASSAQRFTFVPVPPPPPPIRTPCEIKPQLCH